MPRIDIYHLASFRARGAKWVLVGGGGVYENDVRLQIITPKLK